MIARLAIYATVLAGCPASPTDTDVDTDPVDTDAVDTDRPSTSVEATCGPVGDTGERVESAVVEGATVTCDQASCTVALPADSPTRSYARGTFAGPDVLTLHGWEFGELLVATPDGVTRLQVGRDTWAPSPTGTVWLLSLDTLREVRPDGVVVRRCPLPEPAYVDVPIVGEVDGELLVAGLVPERTPRLLRSSTEGWREISLPEVWPESFVLHRDGNVFFGGYGHYGSWSLADDSGVKLGGSDDFFDRFAVCADGTYWVGGGTGMTLACTADHRCARVEEPTVAFQAASTRCDPQGRMVFHHGFDDTPLYTLDRDGTLTEEVVPDGLRHFFGQRGLTWRVVDKQ